LALLQLHQSRSQPPYLIRHHVVTNGNVYLPLAQLTLAQRLLLRPVSGPVLSSLLTGTRFAKGLVRATVSSDLTTDEQASLAAILDYQGGTRVQHAVIQYLHERHAHELEWLDVLRRSEIPTTLVWGELDRIAPVTVADHVWEQCLRDRADTRYWLLPEANHYLQVDRPDVLAALIRSPSDATPGALRCG
jgi:pimeloyl-ACP methyl ester carboxylesterase